MKDPLLYEHVAPLEKNFPVKFALQNGACYLHWHEHMELLLFLSDGASIFCGDATYTLHAGDLIVVNPGELHATYTGSFYCMRLSPAFFADIRFDGVLITPHIAWSPLETRERLIGIVADNLEGFLAGTPRNQVN